MANKREHHQADSVIDTLAEMTRPGKLVRAPLRRTRKDGAAVD